MLSPCVRVGSFWSSSATTPATTGEDIDVPTAIPCVASICRQRESVLPDFVAGHDALVKTLPLTPGFALRLSAETTSAPGAAISGFGAPVTVGPALENQQTSPSFRSRNTEGASFVLTLPVA